MSVYKEHVYLERCFRCLLENNIEAIIIDNDATRESREIISKWIGPVVKQIIHLPNPGTFDWTSILSKKEELVNIYESDWFILWDTDEIREPPAGYATLQQAISEADSEGYNAVNFDEFVFVPIDPSQNYTLTDYVSRMEYYYYFRRARYQRLNAFKKPALPLSLMEGGGHEVMFPGRRIWPRNCALRHYLFLSYEHGREKYGLRDISERDLERGWMRERHETTVDRFRLPDPSIMKRKRPTDDWDTSEPLTEHPSFVYEGDQEATNLRRSPP